MNLLIVSQYFWPENFRINDLAQGLRQRGHGVTVLTGLPNYPEGKVYKGYGWRGPWREERDGIRILRVPLVPRGRSKGLRLALNYASFALSASLLGPFLCRGRYDAILVFEISPVTVGLPAVLLRRLKGCPLLFWVLDLWPETLVAAGAIRSPRVLGWVGRLVRFLYRRCDRILIASRGFAESVAAHGGDPGRIRYFPNWAEEVFQAPPGNENLPSLPPGFRVMFAGNIGAAQDFPTILDAADRLKHIPDIQWVLLGDGRMRDWVEKEVRRRQLSGKVHLLGRFPSEAMPGFFAGADALLVTLRKEPVFALTVPAKLQTYMAAGRPVIAALEGEGRRLVEEAGAGLACPPGDPGALAEAVLELYRLDEANREKLGSRGRRFFEKHFRRESLFDQLEAWIAEAAGSGSGRSREDKTTDGFD